jgi:anthranilate phosphoribosyltransferase
MRRPISNPKTAEALRKTIQHLESDPTVDPQDPAFVHLKCAVLESIMDSEIDKAETAASVQLAEPREPKPTEYTQAARAVKDDPLIA